MSIVRILLSLSLATFALCNWTLGADAQPRDRKGAEGAKPASGAGQGEESLKGIDPELAGAFFPMRSNLAAMKAHGFFQTGLEPVYPDRVKCPAVNSPFAVRTRGDGSTRAPRFFQGFHGGIDIPVPEGTPVVAVAAGTVAFKSRGLSIGGISLVLQHAPTDTGLPVWIYTEYKHLRELPALGIGARVVMGQEVAISGKTGTQDGYYGPAGHPHLHLSAFYSEQPGYTAGLILVPVEGQWMDPLALFLGPPIDSNSVAALPGERKKVRISYATLDGAVTPVGTKLVWPLRCASN